MILSSTLLLTIAWIQDEKFLNAWLQNLLESFQEAIAIGQNVYIS